MVRLSLETPVARAALCRSAASLLAIVPLVTVPLVTRADGGEFAKQGFADRDFALGSKGVSSYESMKLGTALKDLDDATAAAASKAEVVKVLAYYRGVCGYVEGGGRLKPDAGIDDAGRALSELAAGDAALEGIAAQAVKFAGKAVASGGKGDPGPQAVATTDLANVLADFGFAAAAVERELRPKTAIGAPDLRSKAEGIDVTAKRSI